MVIDASAILAILFRESEREEFVDAITTAPLRLVSSLNALEVAIVLRARKGPSAIREFDLLCHYADFEIVSFTEEHFLLARRAYERFGKGRHPAKLNLGDCCAYALSQFSGEPLLFKGNDFTRTDIVSAV